MSLVFAVVLIAVTLPLAAARLTAQAAAFATGGSRLDISRPTGLETRAREVDTTRHTGLAPLNLPRSATAMAPQAAPSPSRPVSIHIIIDGWDTLRLEPRDAPYTEGRPAVGPHVLKESGIRTKDGLIISGFVFQGWYEGEGVRVKAFAVVPGEGEPNVYTTDHKRVRRVEVASRLVSPALSVVLDEIQATGFGEVVLRAVPQKILWP